MEIVGFLLPFGILRARVYLVLIPFFLSHLSLFMERENWLHGHMYLYIRLSV